MAINISNLTNKSNGKNYVFSDLKIDLEEKHTSENKINSDIVPGNDIQIDTDKTAILNSVRNLLTQKRYTNPSWGIFLQRYIGMPINVGTANAIGEQIERGLTLYEPRVTLNKVLVVANPDKNLFVVFLSLSLPNFRDEVIFNGILNNQMNFSFINK